MLSYNESLTNSLDLLYDHLLTFKVSIDLIQKLAQYLKLDTFVDTDIEEQLSVSVKRLSIACSLLLIDIDFSDDQTVTRVSLSLGNYSTSIPNTATQTFDPTSESNRYILSAKDENLVTVVQINFDEENHISFLKTREVDERTTAELILLSNLTGETLGHFPANLKYLINLDSLSPPDGDLVLYLDNVALYLSVVHAQELKLNDDWQIRAGLTNRIGKVALNDESGRLGVFLLFWEEDRFFNKQAREEEHPPTGKIHRALLSVEETNSASVDYLKLASSENFELSKSLGEFQKFQFTFEGDQHLFKGQSVTNHTSRNWNLTLNIEHAVFLPSNLVEFLGISSYVVAQNAQLESVFSRFKQYGEVLFVDEDDTQIKFALDDPSPFVAILSYSLPSLTSLSGIIPALRNHIVFSTLISKVLSAPQFTMSDVVKEDSSKKLKESLKLSNGVGDEELLGLGTDNAEYRGIQLLASNPDLESLVKQEEDTDDIMREESESIASPVESVKSFLTFRLTDINYASLDTELLISVFGRSKGSKEISSELAIKNGQIVQQNEDIGMDTDENASNQFVEALALSEDPLLAFQVLE